MPMSNLKQHDAVLRKDSIPKQMGLLGNPSQGTANMPGRRVDGKTMTMRYLKDKFMQCECWEE